MPPPKNGGSGATPSAAPLNESSASHHSIHSLAPDSSGLTGRELCRAVLSEIAQRRLDKRTVRVNFDGLAANRRRADSALRLVGGDPEVVYSRPSRYRRPSTGLRASGFREGFERGTRDALNRLWPLLDADARKAARFIVADLNLQEAA